jgi:cephalosporin hydroxylase
MAEAKRGSVQVAYLYGNDGHRVSHSFMKCMMRMFLYDAMAVGSLKPEPIDIYSHALRLADSRNEAVKLFLGGDAEWLLWIDTDMGFPPYMAEELMRAADVEHAPVVGALCFALHETESDKLGGFRYQIAPTMYTFGETAQGKHRFGLMGPYPDDTVVQVAGTGSAAILIHRNVFEAMREADTVYGGEQWYSMVKDDQDDPIGEDLAFCLRCWAMRIPVHVHTGVKTTHHKEMYIGEADYQMQPLVKVVSEREPDVPVGIHVGGSLASLAGEHHVHDEMLKLHTDLARYAEVIAVTKPEVIVETGSFNGASAEWFLQTMYAADPSRSHEVISVDIKQTNESVVHDPWGRLTFIEGHSGDESIVELVRNMARGRRTMVVLDSDHSGEHVAREIAAYGPLVSAGCYLVVEDTLFAWAPQALRDAHIPGQVGTPLDAVRRMLIGVPQWSRDMAIERMAPTSHHPAGWWVRNHDTEGAR